MQKCCIVELRLRNSSDGTEVVANAVQIPFICKDIVCMPGQHAFVQGVECGGGTVADKPLYSGIPVVPGITSVGGSGPHLEMPHWKS